MTLYNVHLYREMRLTYESVEADAPHAAAAIALDKSVGAADDIDDCDGETFAALVDVVGDDQYEQSVMIDFEPERLRKAAPLLLKALKALYAAAGGWNMPNLSILSGHDKGTLVSQVCAAIAKATTIDNQPARSDHHA
jgi:hypothetical protein